MRKHRWTLQEQSLLLKRTGELLARGYPLSEAIESISLQLPQKKKTDVRESLAVLNEGYPFYQILSNLKFNHHLVGYVYFAEQHGGLANAFREGSNMMLKRDGDFEKLKKLLVYPLLLIFITTILFVFVKNLILPRFSSLFNSMKLEQNFFTKVVYLFGDIVPYLAMGGIMLLLLLFGSYFFRFRKLPQIRQKKLLVSIPVLGEYFRLFYTHYFSIQMSYLLAGGLSIHEALRLFEHNDKQHFYKELGKEIKLSLRSGKGLEEILVTFPFFEKELATIIRHGQKNGKLDSELYFFSKYCLSLLEEKTEKLLKIVQPCLYILIGFLIVSMYLAVLLPMFHLLEGF